jgi:hypothetical protein
MYSGGPPPQSRSLGGSAQSGSVSTASMNPFIRPSFRSKMCAALLCGPPTLKSLVSW